MLLVVVLKSFIAFTAALLLPLRSWVAPGATAAAVLIPDPFALFRRY